MKKLARGEDAPRAKMPARWPPVPGGNGIIRQVAGDERREPNQAVGPAAAAAGWSHRHRDVSGGWLRPTVFGAVDGLVTNASLIAGLGGGGVSAHAVVLTGVAALVAGAFSMGTGEYVSVTNQNELVHAEVAVERTMHAQFPAAEQAELADTFRGYGADPETAARMAAAVSRDPDTALRVHTREELGVDPRGPALPGGGRRLVADRVLGRGAGAAAALPGRFRRAGLDPGHHRGGAGRRRDGSGPADGPLAYCARACASSRWAARHRGDLRRRQPDRRPRPLAQPAPTARTLRQLRPAAGKPR